MLTAEPNAAVSPTAPAVLGASHSWKELVSPIEPFLRAVQRRLAEQVETFDPAIVGYAQYALAGQGKKLRPALVALSGKATGSLDEVHITIAVIIEMVHLATLVHDDIIDDAKIRRQRPTLALHCGNEISVLLGDCLFAQALKLAASFPSPEVCRAVAAATNTVCAGEILQTRTRHNLDISRAEYFKLLEMKTAELFALSCDLGAWPNAPAAAERFALRNYGLALGTAYQLYDDCLDLFGSEVTAGKSLGTDFANGKPTFPVLVAFERSSAEDRIQLQAYMRSGTPHCMPGLLELLQKHGALSEAQETVLQYIRVAQSALKPLADCEEKDALVSLGDFLAQQLDLLRGS